MTRLEEQNGAEGIENINFETYFVPAPEDLAATAPHWQLLKDSLKGLSRTEQYYHAAQALLRDDILRDPLLASAARHYIASVDYFNDRAGGGQIGRLPAMTRLDVAFVNGPAAMPPSRIPAPNA